MAKSRKQAKAQPKKKPKQRNLRIRNTTFMLDRGAADHVGLLADPCQGRLVPPAYPSPGGGAIIRLKTIVSLANNTGETAGVFHWIPGRNEYYNNGAATNTTNFTPTASSVFTQLTFNAAGNSAASFRCVAACARAMCNTSEMNRAGFIWAGPTTNSFYGNNGGSAVNVSAASWGLPVLARVPAKYLEVLWTPNESDMAFATDSVLDGTGISSNFTNHSAITITASGLPAGTGLTLELTAVYEINYAANSGYVTATPSPVSQTPWPQILGAYYKVIHNAPVIIDTVRRITEYIGAAASSQPGRLVAGAARLALTAA